MRSGVCRPWKMSMNAKAKMLCTQKTVVVSTLADVIAKIMKDPSEDFLGDTTRAFSDQREIMQSKHFVCFLYS